MTLPDQIQNWIKQFNEENGNTWSVDDDMCQLVDEDGALRIALEWVANNNLLLLSSPISLTIPDGQVGANILKQALFLNAHEQLLGRFWISCGDSLILQAAISEKHDDFLSYSWKISHIYEYAAILTEELRKNVLNEGPMVSIPTESFIRM